MMKVINEETKQNLLIQDKIRKASFVSLDSPDTEKFKYNIILKISKYFNNRLIAFKTNCNKMIQKPQLWFSKINFKAIKNDLSIWLLEALIEGFVINFIVWALIGFRFNLITILAWGFAIKQILSIYWRLKKDGSNATIFTKD